MRKIQSVLGQEGEEILESTEALHKALMSLRYEGKVSAGKNIKMAGKAAQILDLKVKQHRDYQEEVVFPFLETHIPKYETRIHFLRSDHHEIKEYAQKLRGLLRRLAAKSGKRRSIDNGAIQETGIYLVGLLRHHLQLEEEGIRKGIEKDLSRSEIADISKKIYRKLAEIQ